MKYQLAKQKFKTKPEITKYFQDFYRTHSVGTKLPKSHRRAMRDLITYHPTYFTWNLPRKPKFKVGRDGFGAKNFWITTNDTGPLVEDGWCIFSYNKCIKGLPRTGAVGKARGSDPVKQQKNRRDNVIGAARGAIKEQIEEFRMSQRISGNRWECVLCKLEVRKVDIDHHFDKLTFQTMLDNWLESLGNTYEDFDLISTKRGHIFDEEDMDLWSEYHRENAKLRCLCWTCHKKKISE